ncbi:hypothetical protein PBPRA1814 [Photobacterium profundum SS9]|uniref:Uncharacterized protein n=1 Tax=Photobacterium profundum (strain SS9) TaxID=298386 RepID=Q6LR57_PHOPR|nr:hypothetical protein PBPRA1814 [Photobacterium profundum SS9]
MSNNKSQNGTSRSDEIFADFQEWKKHVSDDEIREIINDDDCLNRTEISKALDCSRSAVYSNRMQNAITEFEDEKRKEGILPKKSEQDVSKDSNKKGSNSNKGEALPEFNGSNDELLYLRKRNSDLEEENMILKAELKRFGELGALISDELD